MLQFDVLRKNVFRSLSQLNASIVCSAHLTESVFALVFLLQTEAIDVDIDEILDMDNDDIRRSHLKVSVVNLADLNLL